MNFSLLIKTAIGLAGYIVWGLMAWIDPSLRPAFLVLNQAMVAGTIGLVLRDMKSDKDATVVIDRRDGSASVVAQAGFAQVRMLVLLAACAAGAALLSGCGTVLDTYADAAYKQAKVTAARGVVVNRAAFCMQPLAAIIDADPATWTVAKVWCMPANADAATPAAVVPAAK